MTRQPGPGDGYEDDGLFRSVMFGYDRGQVDEYVDAICDELAVLSVAVKQIAPLEQELAVARKEVDRLSSELAAATPGATASVRIQEMLRLAEEEGDRIRAEAHSYLERARADADQIRRGAEIDCEHVAAARRQENQRLREDILAGAHAEAARILSDANVRAGTPLAGSVAPAGNPSAKGNGASSAPSSASGTPQIGPLAGFPVSGNPRNAGPAAVTQANGKALNGNPVNGSGPGNLVNGGNQVNGSGPAGRNSGPQKGGAAKKRASTPLDGPAA
ncbi:MAG: DivIVA domain-containing protein [Hamadaea sp.]|nr:DivIVA domain-containing protein [Hamadaea sp.]